MNRNELTLPLRIGPRGLGILLLLVLILPIMIVDTIFGGAYDRATENALDFVEAIKAIWRHTET